MKETQKLENLHYRMAQYYLNKLHAIASTYERGHHHSTGAVAKFDQEWSQIQQLQDWSAAHSSDDNEIAQLCLEYPLAGAELLRLRQHPEERLEWLEVGLASARRLDHSRAEMMLVFQLGRTHSRLGSNTDAQAFAEQAIALARQLEELLYVCKSLNLLGNIFYGQDEYERSRTAKESALALSEELNEKREMGSALNGLGNVALSQNDYKRAQKYFSRYLEISEAHGEPMDICIALHNLSLATEEMGDHQAATSYAERCIAFCRAIGYQLGLANGLELLGGLAAAQGNLAEARDYIQQSLEISRVIGNRSNEAFALYQLGGLHFQLGDIPASLDCLEAALDLAKQLGERWYSALALRLIAEVLRSVGDTQGACQKLHEGMEIVSSFQSSAIRVKYLLEAALLWRDQGYVDQAALWIGLVGQHVSKLTPEERNLYDHLRQNLKAELGETQFTIALDQGKILNLDSVMQELLRLM
jgi:tetratricopeptide (TPR) repeat protein